MRSRTMLTIMALSVSFLFLVNSHAVFAASSKAKPNVVLILVDDMGWMDLGCQGSKFYLTPNIDKLAKQGMRFTDAYAAAAICSPTRAAVMTGRFPARLGVTDWIRARFQRGKIGTPKENPTEYVGGANQKLLCPPNPYWMDLTEITIAEMLRALGYVTCHIGKWHLGDDAWFPQHQGFDFNFGGCDYGQPPSYFDPYTNKRLPQGIPHLPGRKKGEYLSDREADEAVQFIKKNKDRPFFLYMAHYAVHTPIQAKAEVTAKYEARKTELQSNAKYAAMVESVDDAVGRILVALEEAGVADNTIVIFTSDNGGLRPVTNNFPLRSGKGYAYEGGIRVPLIIRWPNHVPANSVSAEPVMSIDFFPTIAEVCGAKLPGDRDIDGKSLVKLLESGGKKGLDREALYWHFPHYRHAPGPYTIIRKGDWKLTKFYEGPQFELYNLKNDLGEKNNLAEKMPDRVEAMHKQMQQWLKDVNAKVPRPNPGYMPNKKKQKAKKTSFSIFGLRSLCLESNHGEMRLASCLQPGEQFFTQQTTQIPYVTAILGAD